MLAARCSSDFLQDPDVLSFYHVALICRPFGWITILACQASEKPMRWDKVWQLRANKCIYSLNIFRVSFLLVTLTMDIYLLPECLYWCYEVQPCSKRSASNSFYHFTSVRLLLSTTASWRTAAQAKVAHRALFPHVFKTEPWQLFTWTLEGAVSCNLQITQDFFFFVCYHQPM